MGDFNYSLKPEDIKKEISQRFYSANKKHFQLVYRPTTSLINSYMYGESYFLSNVECLVLNEIEYMKNKGCYKKITCVRFYNELLYSGTNWSHDMNKTCPIKFISMGHIIYL